MARNNDDMVAFLGKGTTFKGIITYDGSIRIDGKMEGEIVSQGDLVIGESAVVDAKVSVGSIICGGTISGDLQASKKIHLLSKSTISGSLNTPSLIIDDGVYFNGHCEMKKSLYPPSEPGS